jgi:hypothetical protein
MTTPTPKLRRSARSRSRSRSAAPVASTSGVSRDTSARAARTSALGRVPDGALLAAALAAPALACVLIHSFNFTFFFFFFFFSSFLTDNDSLTIHPVLDLETTASTSMCSPFSFFFSINMQPVQNNNNTNNTV